MLSQFDYDSTDLYEFVGTDPNAGVGSWPLDDVLASLGPTDPHESWATDHREAPRVPLMDTQNTATTISPTRESVARGALAQNAGLKKPEVSHLPNHEPEQTSSSQVRLPSLKLAAFNSPPEILYKAQTMRTPEEPSLQYHHRQFYGDQPRRQQPEQRPRCFSNGSHQQPVLIEPQETNSAQSYTAVDTMTPASNSTMRDTTIEPLESRLERVLSVVEETGFDSIDSMTSTYYTAKFPDHSIMRQMQSVGRTKRLRALLSNLQNCYKSWSERERIAYREEVIRAAEDICSGELQELNTLRLQGFSPISPSSRTSYDPGNMPAIDANRRDIAGRIRELLSHEEIATFIQKDAAMLQASASETWALITELARNAGMQPNERMQVACISLYLLMSPQPMR
ncbi:hypothetical protein F4677DRAFT_382358 [Hypoxylon crocopeplum]|nr:hypothetical protein F4677DRAFT_382358 [Hypoxylon crocopeplum]